MDPVARTRTLGIVMRIVGIIFVVGLYPLTVFWPSGWSWLPAQPAYLQMILGVYAVLGICLFLAARDPVKNSMLVWFTVWSSIVHALIMAWHAYTDPGMMGHMWGDVGALLIVGIVLGALAPRAATISSPARSAAPA